VVGRRSSVIVMAVVLFAGAACSSSSTNEGVGGRTSIGGGGTGGGADGGDAGGAAGSGGTVATGGAGGCVSTLCGSACVSLQDDGKNCGACSHDCLGGACQAGKCQPVELATGPKQGWCLELSADTVYWTASGDTAVTTDDQLLTTPKGGGSATPLVSGKGQPRCLSLDGSSMAWTSLDGSLWVGSASGTNAKQLTSAPNAYGLHLASGFVYYTTLQTPGSVLRIPFTGGTPQTLAYNQTNPVQVVADDASGYAYFTTRGSGPAYADGTLSRVALAGGTVEVLAPNLTNARGVTVYGTSAFWTARGTEGSYTDGTVGRVDLANLSITTLATGLNGPGRGIAVDASDVYVTTTALSGDGTILRIPVAGGSAEPVATAQAAPADLAIDDIAVYWVNETTGTVMRLAK
jgi:hypothetical protein